jgi:predicted nuclease of predicted toxin-antitoxin system
VRFLVDAQLPSALARFLTGRGREARHVMDMGLADASDPRLWDCALRDEWIIITKDEDFYYKSTLGQSGPVIVWVRLGNCRNAVLLAAFQRALPSIERAIHLGERIIEVV